MMGYTDKPKLREYTIAKVSSQKKKVISPAVTRLPLVRSRTSALRLQSLRETHNFGVGVCCQPYRNGGP